MSNVFLHQKVGYILSQNESITVLPDAGARHTLYRLKTLFCYLFGCLILKSPQRELLWCRLGD